MAAMSGNPSIVTTAPASRVSKTRVAVHGFASRAAGVVVTMKVLLLLRVRLVLRVCIMVARLVVAVLRVGVAGGAVHRGLRVRISGRRRGGRGRGGDRRRVRACPPQSRGRAVASSVREALCLYARLMRG